MEFEPMRAGADGRPTLGLRAAGANRSVWLNIPKGADIDVEFIRLLEQSDNDQAASEPRRFEHDAKYRGRRELDVNAIARVSIFEDVEESGEQPTAFDAYLIVDWSASSRPKFGHDSIWWCLCEWHERRIKVRRVENPSTRNVAAASIRSTLLELVDKGSRVLVGFDFPYGYPAGFARALALTDTPWRAVWDEISGRILDDQSNGNNRFQVASDLNYKIGTSAGPFWGHPRGQCFTHLRPTAPHYPLRDIAPLRITERRARTAQSTWKLYGNGSVGSQALLGIPCVAMMREDPLLHEVSAVWPFETGCTLLPGTAGPRIIHAEIYPSMVALPADLGGRVKDCAQVEVIARHLARHDANTSLSDLFAAPARLSSDARSHVEKEEGWILGVT